MSRDGHLSEPVGKDHSKQQVSYCPPHPREQSVQKPRKVISVATKRHYEVDFLRYSAPIAPDEHELACQKALFDVIGKTIDEITAPEIVNDVPKQFQL